MIRGINQSMINRYITGGAACKCINGGSNGDEISGGSNGDSINGGKIEVEFTIYTIEETQEGVIPPITTTKDYMTKDDAYKIYECLYNSYRMNYILTNFEMQDIFDEGIGINRGYVTQTIQVGGEQGESSVFTSNQLSIGTVVIAALRTRYVDGKLDAEASGIEFVPDAVKLVDSSDDPLLEGATTYKRSITFYYRER